MKKEKILTVRWNNWLAFVFGLPILIFVVVVLSGSSEVTRANFVVLLLMGVVY